jgi:hypothetical protein
MATRTRTISASTNGSSGKLETGRSYTYTVSPTHSGVVSYGTIEKAILTISSIQTYISTAWYLEVYVTNTKVARTVTIRDNNSNNHSLSINLE